MHRKTFTDLVNGSKAKLKATVPLIEDCIREETLQQRISCDTTVYSFPSSAYWYLIGGPGPSSRATSMKVAGTFSFRSCVFSATPLWGREEKNNLVFGADNIFRIFKKKNNRSLRDSQLFSSIKPSFTPSGGKIIKSIKMHKKIIYSWKITLKESCKLLISSQRSLALQQCTSSICVNSKASEKSFGQ